LKRIRFSFAPAGVTPTQKKNFINVQVDAMGIGLANAASPFLPIFLTRLGATNFQVGLLTSMPGFTGLVMALLVGRFLQGQRNVVPWFSRARLLVVSAYAATGLAGFIVPEKYLIATILGIWAIATIPQTTVAVAFSVVMNSVAGPTHRYELMSRRWSILGLTSALTVAIVGQVLDKINFPINYQLVFLGLSLGGLISYYFSSHIEIPDVVAPIPTPGRSLKQRFQEYSSLIRANDEFVRIAIKRLVFITGTMLATPLFPLYYVREVQANDSWIGFINMAQTAVLLVGYFIWTRQSRLRGSRFVLIWTTLGISLYPALVASTQRVEIIVLLAAIAGIFQAGIDLVFFDELMKTIPVEQSATFVSLAQSLQYFSAVIAPIVGTLLASWIGLSGALIVSAAIRFTGFLLFTFWQPKSPPEPQPASA
jgi:MFS family permease